jgi:limonene-1,2-epoxide hydrolase
MTPSQIVQAFMDAMAVKDYNTALKYVADHCEYDNVPMGKVTGPAGVRAVLEPFFAPTIENVFVIKRELAEGKTVILERLDRHLLETGWVELPVTGIFEVENGKITLYRDYFDLATIMSKWPQPAA